MILKGVLYDWGGANVWLFHVINQVHGAILDQVMLFGTFLGAHQHFPEYAALITLATLVACYRQRGDEAERARVTVISLRLLAVFVLAYVIDGVLITMLKHTLDLPRPAAVLPADAIQIVGDAKFRYSLPSGHTAFAVVLAATLWPVLPRGARVAIVAFVLWVAVSRVSVGAHFPADVVAGAAIGYVSVALARLGTERALI